MCTPVALCSLKGSISCVVIYTLLLSEPVSIRFKLHIALASRPQYACSFGLVWSMRAHLCRQIRGLSDGG